MTWLEEFQRQCTGVTWIIPTPVTGPCCDEHDVAYEQGGSLAWKWQMDRKLYRCIKSKGHPVLAVLSWLAVTLSPYAYVVWARPEPVWDRIEREINAR